MCQKRRPVIGFGGPTYREPQYATKRLEGTDAKFVKTFGGGHNMWYYVHGYVTGVMTADEAKEVVRKVAATDRDEDEMGDVDLIYHAITVDPEPDRTHRKPSYIVKITYLDPRPEDEVG